VHWVAGEELERDGKLGAALAAFEMAVIASDEEGLAPRNTLAAYRKVGALHTRMHDLSRALTLYQRMLELAGQCRSLPDVCRAHWYIGTTYYAIARAALGLAEKETGGAPSRPAGGLPATIVEAKRQAATPAQLEAEGEALSKALASFEAMLTLARGMHSRRSVARAHEGIGSVAIALGKWELAAEHLELNVKASKAVASPQTAARACRLLAATLGRLRDEGIGSLFGGDKDVFARQVELRWEQAALAEKAGDRALLMDAYVHLGYLFEESGSYTEYYGPQKAQAMYERALAVGRQVDLRTLGTHGAALARDAAARMEALEGGSCTIS
jgi:tetratricopeptide (TPR) repeat protein